MNIIHETLYGMKKITILYYKMYSYSKCWSKIQEKSDTV